METTEIIEKAKETVNGIYEKIGRIDSCQATLKVLDGADVLIGHGSDVSDLHSALSDDQIAEVMVTIHNLVKGNIDEAAGELDRICGSRIPDETNVITNAIADVSAAVPEGTTPDSDITEEPQDITTDITDTAAGETEPVNVRNDTEPVQNETEITQNEPDYARNEPPKSPKASKSTLPPDEEEKLLRQLYVKEQKTVKQIADIMGLTKSNIYDRLKKYGLRNARYDRDWDGYVSESCRRMK